MNWYLYQPCDTIFCKGSEPMVMGENHQASVIFPPPPSTVQGALRTCVLSENNITLEQYAAKEVEEDILSLLGPINGKAGFNVIGPLFSVRNQIFVPAPYHWYIDKPEKDKLSQTGVDKIVFYKAKKINTGLVKGDFTSLYWAKGKEDIVSLGGNWINIKLLTENRTSSEGSPSCSDNDFEAYYITALHKYEHIDEETLKKAIITASALYSPEPRTGIAFDVNGSRRVREGHLYTFNHVRLNKDVGLVFGTDKPLKIPVTAKMKLGGEKRFGSLITLDNNHLLNKLFQQPAGNNKESIFLSLSAIPATDELTSALVAAGKPLYFGGWDMYKGFHKPLKTYFPAGTTFNTKTANMISI